MNFRHQMEQFDTKISYFCGINRYQRQMFLSTVGI
jgi:hypothetical protein